MKTRKAVYKAFAKLLASKPYSAITIQDIIDEADIGRSTFYSHFETKDELLNDMCMEIFDHVFTGTPEKEAGHDFSHSDNLEGELIHILYHVQDLDSHIKGILSSESGQIFLRFFKDHLTEVFEKIIERTPEGVPRDYYLNYLVSGFTETMRWWVDTEYTPEEAVRLYLVLYRME